MRFLHCSDIHLGRRPAGSRGLFSETRYADYFASFNHIVETAIERKLDALLITGDFFDKKELQPEVLIKAEEFLLKLKEASLPVILIEGNHDNIYADREDESWIIYLEKKGYVKRPYARYQDKGWSFEKIEIRGVYFYGLGYQGVAAPEAISALSEILDYDNKNVVLIHSGLGVGRDNFWGTIEKSDIECLKDKALYVAGGHLHGYSVYPSENPFFFLPGSSEYFNINDNDDKKDKMGMIIFDTDTKDYEFIPSLKRNKVVVNLDFHSQPGLSHEDSIIRQLNSHYFNNDMVVVNINANEELYINQQIIEEFIISQGALKAAVKINSVFGANNCSLRDSSLTTLSEIEFEIIKSWEGFASSAKKIANALDSMKNSQRGNFKEHFEEVFLGLIDSIIEGEAQNDNQ